MYHTMNEIFDQIEQKKSSNIKYAVTVSFMEIYNENLRDLIVPSNENITMKEDGANAVKVLGISTIKVSSAPEILDLLT